MGSNKYISYLVKKILFRLASSLKNLEEFPEEKDEEEME